MLAQFLNKKQLQFIVSAILLVDHGASQAVKLCDTVRSYETAPVLFKFIVQPCYLNWGCNHIEAR